MSQPTAEQIGHRAVDLQLLDARQLSEVMSELGSRNVTPDALVRQFVRREFLTNWQVERLVKGETTGFYYGPCKILYLVGTGTFSRVYRAENTDTGEIVALKVLRRRFSEDAKACEQFFREGEMGRRLRHPNIVPIYDVVSKGQNHYLVMEFVEGRNLREFVKTRRKVPPLEATKLMGDITSALSYAFTNGVHHRDLKMTNVLISSRGSPKLVDFGLASMAELQGDEENPRTIDYAGLERATGVRKDDQRSDIFFLGAIYYHLLSGKAPLAETKDRSIRLSKSRYLEVTPIHQVEPDLPAGVASVVMKSMEPNADRRYQTPAEMLLDLKTLAHRLQVAANRAAGGDLAVAEGEVDTELLATQTEPQGPRKSVMIVESNVESQEALRTGLKRIGFRVLLTIDPTRALSRFEEHEKVADCVVFSTGDLGEPALDAFNRFGTNSNTAKVPAVLLLGGTQAAWKSKAKLADHRIVMVMPIKLKQFRATLMQLMGQKVTS